MMEPKRQKYKLRKLKLILNLVSKEMNGSTG